MTKSCTTCKETRPITEFSKAPRNSDGLKGQCKSCVNARRRVWRRNGGGETPEQKKSYALRRDYGLTLDDYEEILKSQDSQCAICRKHAAEVPRKVLYVDHDHDTGEVRGLLCSHCNAGIGNLMDDPAVLKEAVRYLEAGI